MTFHPTLKKIPNFTVLSRIVRKRNLAVWLVGGFLRDSLLGVDKFLSDFDFCVAKDTTSLAREFAKQIKAKCIVLDEEQESLRVIFKKNNRLYTYDFSRLRGKDLKEDLSLRDFSINTLALSLNQKSPKLLDYYRAQEDLKRGWLRVVKRRVLADDPLRIIRAFSLSANYSFKIQPKTLLAMAASKKLIKKVSPERLSEELFKIFLSADSYQAVKLMDKLKIIDEVLPVITKTRGVRQGGYHHLDVWKHSLETLRQFELLYNRRLAKDNDSFNYLNQEVIYNRRRFQVIKLACLLHDIGKPSAKKRLKKKTIFHTHEKIGSELIDKLAERLRLSSREIEVLKKLIFWHLRPGYLADQSPPTRRAIYRFFRDTKEDGVAVIILSLSDWRATRGPLTDFYKRRKHEKIMLELIKAYFSENKRKPLVKLADGHMIMNRFKLKPSPLVGKLLRKINEEQALGKISTPKEALSLAKEIIENLPTRGRKDLSEPGSEKGGG
ncbi:MAG: HD domain-containing protein [Candidatus Omnitrophica bacterium]|nr:HD domain-containing protein [Candidatus Omnitrophota bacterium]MBU2265817.1 HD domain-containing protein [Candidatus Omnitrophota bacterium]MBU2473987.1 HD domain-containing protein [Candidatus Omnitrophota bacterium]